MSELRVLVVDHDPELSEELGAVLASEGYAVEAAVSGAAGLAAANADIPDLIICEVELPDMNGWNFIRQLRAAPQFAFVPVMFLSAIADETVRIRGFRLGADDVLVKPVDVTDLAMRVARVLADSYRIEHAVRVGSEEASHEGGAGMRGTLADVGLSTLLSIFEIERAGGVLTVTNSDTGQIGRVYLRSGQVVRARYQGLDAPRNREVVFGMLRWSRGHFAFRGAYIAGENEIGASAMHLLIEGARRLDDATREIRKRVPGADAADAGADAGAEPEPEEISPDEARRMLEAGRHGRRRSSVRAHRVDAPAAAAAPDGDGADGDDGETGADPPASAEPDAPEGG